MSVRQSLLAILDQGPCYGYQLRAEFDLRTGSTWPLNVGQIYNTLERLERDGLVQKGEADENGHVYYEITDAGRVEVREWLDSPVSRPPGTRDELAVKLALAATLPGADVTAIISSQREASLDRLRELRGEVHDDPDPGDPQQFARALVRDSMICLAEAEVRWLERIEQRLGDRPQRTPGIALSAERPKRGRPAKASAGHS